MKKNIAFAELIDWVEGRLDETEAERVAESLATAAAAVQANAAWLQEFQHISRRVTLPAPPTYVREALAARFSAYAQDRPQPGLWQRLLASLNFDSRQQFAVAGVRSAATQATERQLIYATPVAEVALNLQPGKQDDQLLIMGQLFPLHEEDRGVYTVQLLRPPTVTEKRTVEWGLTHTDELGEFTFESVEPGVYDMVVSGGGLEEGGVEIIITPIDVRSSPID
jgi:hypothetical protein